MPRPANWAQVSEDRGTWARRSLLKALHDRCSPECYPERRKYSRTELVKNVGDLVVKPGLNLSDNPWVALKTATPAQKPFIPSPEFCEANTRIWNSVRKDPTLFNVRSATGSDSSWVKSLDNRGGLPSPRGKGPPPGPALMSVNQGGAPSRIRREA